MAYNHKTEYGRVHNMSTSNKPAASHERINSGEEECASDVDEPPDDRITFKRRNTAQNQNQISRAQLLGDRRASLLTQGLLTSPTLTVFSDSEAPVLTSDGGMTSPTRTNTPSPPLPPPAHADVVNILGKGGATRCNVRGSVATIPSHEEETSTKLPEPTPEAPLARKRCITFACGRQEAPQCKPSQVTKPEDDSTLLNKAANPPKRPCMLRFACPMKPSSEAARKNENVEKTSEPVKPCPSSPQPTGSMSIPGSSRRAHRDSESTIKNSSTASVSRSPRASRSISRTRKASAKSKKLDGSEATRFHEFAGSFLAEDEWTKEQTAYRQKITVNDTLRKENAIRKLAQEAEEEALEDDVDGEVESDESRGDEDDEEERLSDNEVSDGGNESDDEEGFADSDDESDVDSQYQFWTTSGLTTAATSTDHVERIRPMTHRLHSDSSIDSMDVTDYKGQTKEDFVMRAAKGIRSRKAPRLRPGTPDLPDSTDFVCGTLDEDRPLEAAYMSCLEERKRSKHKVIPQDIDPSFPTSDLEEEEEEEEEEDVAVPASDELAWVIGRPDNSDGEQSSGPRKRLSRRSTKSPMPSPKRFRSPAPTRHAAAHRSPPPRRLFGQSPRHSWAPVPFHGKVKSPPSTRRTTPCASPGQNAKGLNLPHLAQRPHLTHTTSLPRTPNPFWGRHLEFRNELRESSTRNTSKTSGRDSHSRGPIDIIKGIEHRRQRRREKFWRQHCRTSGRERERRCQPGKGAERMRELGLEMAVRCKGYGLKTELILSA